MSDHEALFEILELSNGDVILRDEENPAEPWISVRFSKRAESFLGEYKLEVTREMIVAGMAALNERHTPADADFDDSSEGGPEPAEIEPRTIH